MRSILAYFRFVFFFNMRSSATRENPRAFFKAGAGIYIIVILYGIWLFAIDAPDPYHQIGFHAFGFALVVDFIFLAIPFGVVFDLSKRAFLFFRGN